MKIALLGFYNKSNFGDDLMAEILPGVLARPGVDSCQPFGDTNGRFALNGVSDPTYLQHDLIVIGGGGIVTNEFWCFAHDRLEAMKNSKKPIAFVNVNVTNYLRENMDFAHKLRDLQAKWWVRDLESVEILNAIGIESQMVPDVSLRPGVISTGDSGDARPKQVLVFLNSYIFNQMFNHSNVFNYLKSNESIRLISQHIDWLMNFGWKVTFCAAHTAKEVDDRIPSAIAFALSKNKQLCNWVSEPLEWRQMVQMIAESGLVVSMRYHSSLVALAAGTPLVDITHHPKNARLMLAAGVQQASVDYQTMTRPALIKATQAAERLIPNSEGVQMYLAEARALWARFDQEWAKFLESIESREAL